MRRPTRSLTAIQRWNSARVAPPSARCSMLSASGSPPPPASPIRRTALSNAASVSAPACNCRYMKRKRERVVGACIQLCAYVFPAGCACSTATAGSPSPPLPPALPVDAAVTPALLPAAGPAAGPHSCSCRHLTLTNHTRRSLPAAQVCGRTFARLTGANTDVHTLQ